MGCGGPDEGFGCLVVLGEVVVDGRLQFGNAFEYTAADGIAGDLGEEAFHLVQPGSRGRREVEMEARVLFQPLLDLSVLVGGVVVDDQMDVELFRRLAVELAQETEEFLMPVALHALTDDRAVEHVQRREQRGRAVAFVIVSDRAPGSGSSRPPKAPAPCPAGSGKGRQRPPPSRPTRDRSTA